jgi:hypothetical protein
MAAAQSGNLSIGGIISQVVAGGAGGAILTAIIGAIKNKSRSLTRTRAKDTERSLPGAIHPLLDVVDLADDAF